MLRERLISGTLLVVVLVSLMVLDGWLSARPAAGPAYWLTHGAICTLLVTLITLGVVRELLSLAAALGYRPLRFETYVFAASLAVGPWIGFNLERTSTWYGRDESWGMLWLTIALGYCFCAQAVRRGTRGAIVNIAITLLYIFLAGGLAGYMTRLRMEIGGPQGAAILVFSMFVAKLTDIGAYFTGLLAGRHKLVPWLSPKKTWEGLAGGILTAIAGALGLGLLLDQSDLVRFDHLRLSAPLALSLFGLVMALFATAGDLAESLIKRDAEVKDSGDSVPGMGGVLDVADSALLAAPVAWFYWLRVVPL